MVTELLLVIWCDSNNDLKIVNNVSLHILIQMVLRVLVLMEVRLPRISIHLHFQ